MTDDNVVILPCLTKLDIPPERVLKAALEENMSSAVVMGYDENGEFYLATSISHGPDVLWLLELAKEQLFDMCRPPGDSDE